MPFPTGENTRPLIQWMGDIQRSVIGLKRYSGELQAAMQGNISANQVLDYIRTLTDVINLLNEAEQVPGLPAFAQQQFGNSDADLVALGQALRAVLVDTRNVAVTIIPRDADGYVLKDRFDAGFDLTVRALTPAETAPLAAKLADVVGAIE